MASNGASEQNSPFLTNYCRYLDSETNSARIGHLSEDRASVQPLAFKSGTPLTDLYQVIEAGERRIIRSGDPLQTASTKLLAPISGRDILCVGKNYAAHATEFNKSGYDSSDKVDQPTHPVIFTKRFTSIIADGEEIYPHPEFTETVDYEGELAVIIGESGYRITEADAMSYVWGYTICNDVTARERQRDHKQFYIGKSPDSFCPLGPVAVPAARLPKIVQVQTRVNSELRQDATTEDLIFSIPSLIKTLSEGQTLMPGDVLATGTPAGVGFGQNPPVYLQPGDEVAVTISGLGTLTNRIASKSAQNLTLQRTKREHDIHLNNMVKSPSGAGLSMINGKPMHCQNFGNQSGPPAVFVHGLGGSVDYWTPLIQKAGLRETHALHLYDFEGHGLSPTSPLSELTISSLAEDLKGVFRRAEISSGAVLFAHSLGCLIAVQFVLRNPSFVSKLILMGPPSSPLPETGTQGAQKRATLARSHGMDAVVDTVVSGGTSEKSKKDNPLAITAVRLSLLAQDPEGYAKACSALAKATDPLYFSQIQAETSIITGAEDKISSPELCEKYDTQLSISKGLTVLPSVGHWHVFEDTNGVAKAVQQIL